MYMGMDQETYYWTSLGIYWWIQSQWWQRAIPAQVYLITPGAIETNLEHDHGADQIRDAYHRLGATELPGLSVRPLTGHHDIPNIDIYPKSEEGYIEMARRMAIGITAPSVVGS